MMANSSRVLPDIKVLDTQPKSSCSPADMRQHLMIRFASQMLLPGPGT